MDFMQPLLLLLLLERNLDLNGKNHTKSREKIRERRRRFGENERSVCVLYCDGDKSSGGSPLDATFLLK